MQDEIEFTKMSSKGQVVIPRDMREAMHLKKGTPFAILNHNDMIILKKVEMPTIEDFEKLVDKGIKAARKEGLKEEDIEGIVHKHRGIK